MKLRAALALVVLCPLVGLVTLAYASPPDPSWVEGIYDDADFDDIIVFITSGAAVAEPFTSEAIGPAQVIVRFVPHSDTDPVLSLRSSSESVRAPPAS
jgi:hypothetical protein